MALPAWFSWMGDLVPERDRGRYFGIRDRAINSVGIIAVLVGAFVLDILKTRGFALLGFAILFGLAFLFRFISYFYLRKQYSPRFRVKKSSYFSVWSFIKTFDNYGKFVTYKLATPPFLTAFSEVSGANYRAVKPRSYKYTQISPIWIYISWAISKKWPE